MDVDSANPMPPAALAVGLAGTVPFWIGAAAYLWPPAMLGTQSGLTILVGYAAVVLGFLGGVRWGRAIAPIGRRRQAGELTLGVAPPLAGAASLFLPAVLALALLVSAFLLQALWDVTDAQRGRLPGWYARLRLILTTLVMPALLLALAKALYSPAA